MQVDGKEIPSEVVMMQKAGSHRNIVTLYDFEVTADTVVLVLERPDPVLDYTGYHQRTPTRTMRDRVAKMVIRQLIEAVIHCHSKAVFHGDIKEENFLIDLNSGRVLLIDFGLAKEIGDEPLRCLFGKWFIFSFDTARLLLRQDPLIWVFGHFWLFCTMV